MRASLESLSKLKRLPRNPKQHDLGEIHLSYKRFGFIQRIVINDVTGRLIAGHGRVDALQQRKVQGETPPKNVELQGGEWMVPADHVSIPEEEEEAASIALNRLTEKGGWDETQLVAVLSDLAAGPGLEGLGYDEDDLDALLAFSSFDQFEDIPELDWEEPEMAFRVIIQCETEAERDALLNRLKLSGEKPKVRYDYKDIDWGDDEVLR